MSKILRKSLQTTDIYINCDYTRKMLNINRRNSAEHSLVIMNSGGTPHNDKKIRIHINKSTWIIQIYCKHDEKLLFTIYLVFPTKSDETRLQYSLWLKMSFHIGWQWNWCMRGLFNFNLGMSIGLIMTNVWYQKNTIAPHFTDLDDTGRVS